MSCVAARSEAQLARVFSRVSLPKFLSTTSAFNCRNLLSSPHRQLAPTADLRTASPCLEWGTRHEMVRSAVARYVKQAFKHSRGLHTTARAHESTIAHLLDQGPQDSERVVINGFIRSIRNQKQRSFASVGDGSSLEPLQALLTPQQSARSELPAPLHTLINSNQTAG